MDVIFYICVICGYLLLYMFICGYGGDDIGWGLIFGEDGVNIGFLILVLY